MNASRRIQFIGGATLAALAFAAPVSAHNAAASATCQGGVSYNATSYENVANTVTVKWDGVTAGGYPKTFTASSSGTVANPNKTVAHTWQVVVDQYGSNQFDFTYSGEVAACVVVAPTTTTTTTLPPTTTTVGTSSIPVTTVTASDDETTPVVTTTTAAPLVVVAVADPPVPPAASSVSQTLPATGMNLDLTLVASILVACGAGAAAIARRRTP